MDLLSFETCYFIFSYYRSDTKLWIHHYEDEILELEHIIVGAILKWLQEEKIGR